MWIIKNNTKGKIRLTVGEHILKLEKDESKDLDAIYGRALAESSVALKYAIDKLSVLEMQKDDITKNVDAKALAAMEQRIIAQLRQNPGNVDTSISDKISALIDTLEKSQNKNTAENEAEMAMDDDKQLDIHARTIARVSKNSSGQVNSEQIVSDSNVSEKADELEGFI